MSPNEKRKETCLVSHGPEEAAAVLLHVLDDEALLPHLPLEPPVLLSPLLLGQVQAQVGVLVLCEKLSQVNLNS